MSCRYTVVENEKVATPFIQYLSSGKTFVELAKKYAIAPQYVLTANPTKIMKNHPQYGLEKDHLRPAEERIVLQLAKDGKHGIQLSPFPNGHFIAEILEVKAEGAMQTFQKSRSVLEQDFQRKILARQLKVDIQKMQQELQFH